MGGASQTVDVLEKKKEKTRERHSARGLWQVSLFNVSKTTGCIDITYQEVPFQKKAAGMRGIDSRERVVLIKEPDRPPWGGRGREAGRDKRHSTRTPQSPERGVWWPDRRQAQSPAFYLNEILGRKEFGRSRKRGRSLFNSKQVGGNTQPSGRKKNPINAMSLGGTSFSCEKERGAPRMRALHKAVQSLLVSKNIRPADRSLVTVGKFLPWKRDAVTGQNA